MKKELLEKYLKNNCTAREFDELVGWVNTEAQNNEAKGWGYEQWEMLEPDQQKKMRQNLKHYSIKSIMK